MVDFTSTIELIYAIIRSAAVAGFTALVPFAINWVLTKTRLDKLIGDDVVRTYLYDILERGLKAGLKYTDGQVKKVNGVVTVDNDILEFALNYAKTSAPDALARFGLTDDAKIKTMLNARLEDAFQVDFDGDGVIGGK